MSVNTGFEFVTEHVMPIIRSLIAKRLTLVGFSQLRIAKVLGITQPAVNRYINKDEGKLLGKIRELGIDSGWVMGIVDNVVRLVMEGREYEALEYLTNEIALELGSLRLCNAHRRVVPTIPTTCNVCSILLAGISDSVIKNLERALSILESHPEVRYLIPRVLMNIVEAKPNAATEDDVAGVPGRIGVFENRVVIGSRPSYGGSKHLGRLIVRVMAHKPQYRSVASIKYDEEVEEAIKSSGFRYSKVGPHEKPNEDEVVDNVTDAIRREPDLDVVIDLGGYGLEPVTYVFGMDSVDTVMKIIKIASHMKLTS
ncbi:thiamine-phosphate synthase family protein [Vulcanisaeta thermophila]|uniref:thiamine-phosphate synthase family protein n=1 Tax=Vulcanisaeta thermophila TaxID=867917 RepID=UPI00085358AF|nr:thiamine-phosphate synthase family protein [Vulcanisaeta thermophila]